ncbi:hypothetical protein PXD04_08005 [Methanosphaera sp. ISO3-F5]|uniref:hypothetical protein n=1 Tax=Methanosphaera sp. ISO3-F5 TaxID=1452353 RepID=UPI002B25E35A|nr:hypothetical protein [Methanosphaera sp. ISO3-F5]WQH63638.1 hypothetical protein PXD04_08005 [Methanosphaera sp. ISO3-F5]
MYFRNRVKNNTFKSEFIQNKAQEVSGGALLFHDLTTNNIFESIFKYNEGVNGGGIFFFNQTHNNTFNSDLRYNTAKAHGGAIIFFDLANNNKIKGKFINNTAPNGNGGALIFRDTSTNNSFECDFINNTANNYGGAVNYRETPYNIVFNSNFINNKAEYGGGINFLNNMVNVKFNGKFINNSAVYGGGLYVHNATIEKASFIDNHAKFGGAIFTNDTLLVNNTRFLTNNAESGGAIYANNTEPSLYNCVLINNTNDTFNCDAFTYNCTIEPDDSKSDNSSNKTTPQRSHKTSENVRLHKSIENNKIGQNIYTIKLASDNTVVFTGNKLTLNALNKIFNLNFTNGHLLVYIDGVLVFNGTTSEDSAMLILELLDKYLGVHEIKVVFTDNENQTNTYTENIIIG